MRANDRLRRAAMLWALSAVVGLCGPMSPVAKAQIAPLSADKGADRGAPAVKARAKTASASSPLTLPTATKPGFSFQIGPAPAWVVPVEAPTGAPAEPSPMHYRVIDEQLRVEGTSMSEYTRVIRVIGDAAGLAVASQIEVEFDPSYQTLVLHKLDVLRQGRRVNKLDSKRVNLLQREKQLEQRVYDGRVTASIVLDDMRLGDEIDFAYTVNGLNPVFGGKFVHTGWMRSQRGPVMQYQIRLLAPAERDIRIAKGPVDATQTSKIIGGRRETVFKRSGVAVMRYEPGASAAVFLADQLHFSEFADWGEVAGWGERLFSQGVSARAAQKAEEIRATQPRRADQVLEALRFVQQDVRYFGIEMGPGSHRPSAPDQVLEQRYGDCKDKVALLSAMLKHLDVRVRPVLVSTSLRGQVDQVLPSPLAFDHVIARVDFDGQSFLLDPTRSQQTGNLASRAVVGLGQGLELATDVKALSALAPAYDTERLQISDTIRVTHFAVDPMLESRIVYRGEMAEAVRESVALQGVQQLVDAVNQSYVRVYPRLRSLGSPRLEPTGDENSFTLVQQFEIPEFWRFPEQRQLTAEIVQWAPIDWLMPPKSESRTQALTFPFPGVFRHKVRLEFEEDVWAQPGSRRTEDGDRHFSLVVQTELEKRHAEANVEVRIGVDRVEPTEWADFSVKLSQALPKLSSVVAVSAVPLSQLEALSGEIKAIDDSLRKRRIKAVTAVQTQSHFKLKVLTAQIDAGRLSLTLKSQALVARGIAYDNLGQIENGRKDLEAALALDATSMGALNAAAANALARGAFEQAVEYASRALSLQPLNTNALQTRALAYYFAGRMAEARSDLDAALSDRSALRRGYPLLWQALATRRAGQDLALLTQKYPREQWSSEWPRPVLDAVFGTATAESAFGAARASKTPLEAQTEALYYLGEMLAVDGDAGKAREQWRKVVDLGVVEFTEYQAAKLRLGEAR